MSAVQDLIVPAAIEDVGDPNPIGVDGVRDDGRPLERYGPQPRLESSCGRPPSGTLPIRSHRSMMRATKRSAVTLLSLKRSTTRKISTRSARASGWNSTRSLCTARAFPGFLEQPLQ